MILRPIKELRYAVIGRCLSYASAAQQSAQHKAVFGKDEEPHIIVRGQSFEQDSMTNITPAIISKIDAGLLGMPNHPICLMKEKIFSYFKGLKKQKDGCYTCKDLTNPVVTVKQNFDDLGFPSDHVGRTLHDSYYINREWMLRTHMTANERTEIEAGHRAFLLAGDVYRRDEIDARHYPVFHQIEGVSIFRPDELKAADLEPLEVSAVLMEVAKETQPEHRVERAVLALADLQKTLDGLLQHLFGQKIPIRWQPCYFPFTQPSLEIEVFYRDRWVEVLGSGLLNDSFLRNAGLCDGEIAWAFGMGIERLAMIFYDIPDIRLFWSNDPRFLSQFDARQTEADLPSMKFQPYSKYPHIRRDLSFWLLRPDDFEPNALFEIMRSVAGDLLESAELIDTFARKEDGRRSNCYRLVYRHMDRSLTDEEVNELQQQIRDLAAQTLPIELR